MAHSTQVSVPAVDLGEELVANMAVGVDRRARPLRTMLRAVAITSAGVALLELLAGFAYREPRGIKSDSVAGESRGTQPVRRGATEIETQRHKGTVARSISAVQVPLYLCVF